MGSCGEDYSGPRAWACRYFTPYTEKTFLSTNVLDNFHKLRLYSDQKRLEKGQPSLPSGKANGLPRSLNPIKCTHPKKGLHACCDLPYYGIALTEAKQSEHILQHTLKRPRGFPMDPAKRKDPRYQHGPVRIVFSKSKSLAGSADESPVTDAKPLECGARLASPASRIRAGNPQCPPQQPETVNDARASGSGQSVAE